MKKLATILILITFLIGLMTESRMNVAFFTNADQQLAELNSKVLIPFLIDFNCNDCDNNGAQNKESHCSHHSNAAYNVTCFSYKSTRPFSSRLDSHEAWYLINHYQAPFLDLALKPPTYS